MEELLHIFYFNKKYFRVKNKVPPQIFFSIMKVTSTVSITFSSEVEGRGRDKGEKDGRDEGERRREINLF